MLGLTISRRAIRVPAKLFPPVQLVASQSRSGQEHPSQSTQPPLPFDHPSTRLLPDVSIARSSVPTPQILQRRLINRRRLRRGNKIPRGIRQTCYAVRRGWGLISDHSDERYMVARILVGTTMPIITRMDNPQWFRENAEPYVFSRMTRLSRT